jgi:hypothetical protein
MRFCFVKSLINSIEFEEAVQKVVSNPTTKWEEEQEEKDIRGIRRFTQKSIKQFVTKGNRIEISEAHFLYKLYKLTSIPLKIDSARKIESTDTPENRFIKHALEEFLFFCENKARNDSGTTGTIPSRASSASHHISTDGAHIVADSTRQLFCIGYGQSTLFAVLVVVCTVRCIRCVVLRMIAQRCSVHQRLQPPVHIVLVANRCGAIVVVMYREWEQVRKVNLLPRWCVAHDM